MPDLQERITGVLVFDGEPEIVAVQDGAEGGAVLVFDGRPSVGAITRQTFAGVAVVATTGPRGIQGIQGDPGTNFILLEPGEEPPPGTPDGTFVFEHVG